MFFVPKISKNIISVSKFASQNQVSIEFLPHCFLVKDLQTGTVLLKGPCVDGVYSWPFSRSPHVFVTQVSDGSSWHHKLGHPSPPILKFLQSRFQLGISHSKSDFCNSCSINKSHRLPFQKSTISSTFPLEVIYSDLWTSPVISHDGYRYYVIFVDHFTKYIWFYPLKHKSDTTLTFIKFKALVETISTTKSKFSIQIMVVNLLPSHPFFPQMGSLTLLLLPIPHNIMAMLNDATDTLLKLVFLSCLTLACLLFKHQSI